ncbi:MAG: DUF1080 domain-containing protein [Planctomycetes bacterium]|nr:DUF1080 domain-containing protein [Planctomycetota bacterium]
MNGRLLLPAWLWFAGCQAPPPPAAPWQSLFDGAGLGPFTATAFGGEGEVAVRDGRLQLGQGSPLTGVHWTGPLQTGPLPSGDYELELVARRELGNDFFCGLTFPVGSDHLTLVLGGWGGSVCGLSNLDGLDASRNATRTLRHFAAGVDHRVQLRVQRERVEVLVDGAPLLSIDPRQHRLALRPEVELCRPLGLCSYNTAASFPELRWRPLAR